MLQLVRSGQAMSCSAKLWVISDLAEALTLTWAISGQFNKLADMCLVKMVSREHSAVLEMNI